MITSSDIEDNSSMRVANSAKQSELFTLQTDIAAWRMLVQVIILKRTSLTHIVSLIFISSDREYDIDSFYMH